MKWFHSILAASAVMAGTAHAQSDVSATVQAEDNPRLKRNTFEVRPVEVLAAAVPGVASGGASYEAYLGSNWAANVGGSYADVDMPQKYIGTTNDQADSALVEDGYGYSVGAGVRYYDDPIGDSAYGGFNIDYSELRYGFEFEDETYATEQYAVTPSLTAGYRWVWQNGVLARLGAGVGLPSVQSQSVISETNGPSAEEGLDSVNDILDQDVLAKLDLGVGMMF
jgi:hypothetical protein